MSAPEGVSTEEKETLPVRTDKRSDEIQDLLK